MRSRLRRPTSKSITFGLVAQGEAEERRRWWWSAHATLCRKSRRRFWPYARSLVDWFQEKMQGFKAVRSAAFHLEPHLGRFAQDVRGQRGFGCAVDAGNGHELRLQAVVKMRAAVLPRPCNGAAPQRGITWMLPSAITSAPNSLRPAHHQVGAARIDLLARTQGLVDHDGAWSRPLEPRAPPP